MQAPVGPTTVIRRLFLVSGLIAVLNGFARPDFNLPLYIFAYLAWGFRNQKARIAWTLAVTLVADILWIVYWSIFYYVNKTEKGFWQTGVHSFVIFFSSINVILKAVSIFLINRQETEVKETFTTYAVRQSVLNLFSTRV